MLNPINLNLNLNSSFLSIVKNAIINNEITLIKNLDLETLTLDLSNHDTLKLYKMNQELQNINNRVNFLIYKLICLFNFLLSKKSNNQLFIK